MWLTARLLEELQLTLHQCNVEQYVRNIRHNYTVFQRHFGMTEVYYLKLMGDCFFVKYEFYYPPLLSIRPNTEYLQTHDSLLIGSEK